MMFWVVFIFVICQRIAELFIARRNEKWILANGGTEVGQEHYKLIVSVHVFFFLSLLFEVLYFEKELSPFFPVLFSLFIVTQLGRLWALSSLGKFWNTKIMILPNHEIVSKGPYKFIKHPNYLIVILEIMLLPLMFEAYVTACVCSILNLIVLSIRIPIEERALQEFTNYGVQFEKND